MESDSDDGSVSRRASTSNQTAGSFSFGKTYPLNFAPRQLDLHDIQEVQPHKADFVKTAEKIAAAQKMPSKVDTAARPENSLDYLSVGIVLEMEKKCLGSVWHKTEYAMAKNGLIYRKRMATDKELTAFDLCQMTIDKLPFAEDFHVEHPIESIRLLTFGAGGQECVWLIKHDEPTTLMGWYDEMKTWKDEWHYQDWKNNLVIQIPRVALDPEKDVFDLARKVASERLYPSFGQDNPDSTTVLHDDLTALFLDDNKLSTGDRSVRNSSKSNEN